MRVRGETITMRNFSPRQLLVLLPYDLRAFFTGAATVLALLPCVAPVPLSSCPKTFLFLLSNPLLPVVLHTLILSEV